MKYGKLKCFKDTLASSLEIPGYFQEAQGLLNGDFIEALHRVFITRINKWAFLAQSSHSLGRRDADRALTLLKQKMTTDSEF